MSDAPLPPLPRIQTGHYRHYKGKEYEVLGVVRHSETLEHGVCYQLSSGRAGVQLGVEQGTATTTGWPPV